MKGQFKKGNIPWNKGKKMNNLGGYGGRRIGRPRSKSKYLSYDGYFLLYLPNYTGCNVGGTIREHRFIAERELGRPLKNKEVIHHIDRCKTNNHPENLYLFSSEVSHRTFHHNPYPVQSNIVH